MRFLGVSFYMQRYFTESPDFYRVLRGSKLNTCRTYMFELSIYTSCVCWCVSMLSAKCTCTFCLFLYVGVCMCACACMCEVRNVSLSVCVCVFRYVGVCVSAYICVNGCECVYLSVCESAYVLYACACVLALACIYVST